MINIQKFVRSMVKYNLLLFIAWIFITENASAQYGRYEPGGYIGLSGGIASPSAGLAKKDFNDINSGFALNGLNFNVSFAYKWFQDKYGIASILSYSAFPVDIDALQMDLPNIDPFNTATAHASNTNISMGSLLVGPYAQFRIARKTYINFRLMFGPSYFNFPSYTAFPSNSSGSIPLKDGYEKIAFSYDFGICFKYMLTTYLYLLGDVDFYTSRIELDKLRTINAQGITHYDNVNQRNNSNNVTIGLGFFLDR